MLGNLINWYVTNVLDLGAGRVAVVLSVIPLADRTVIEIDPEVVFHIRQVDLLVGVVLVRLGSHDGYLDASGEADAGSVMTKGGGAVSVAR